MVQFTRIKNDINGNPRFVCHFLNLITDKDREQVKEKEPNGLYHVGMLYKIAHKRAKQLGGKKYTGKEYGGGFVFQMYEGQRIEINNLINEILK